MEKHSVLTSLALHEELEIECNLKAKRHPRSSVFVSLFRIAARGRVCNSRLGNTAGALLKCTLDVRMSPKKQEVHREMRTRVLQVIEDIDAVLLSHPDPAHIGALPYLVGRRKLQAPIYATVPVQKMGQMFLYDQFLSRWQTSEFNTFSLDDVDAAFQRIRQVKYQQQVKLAGISHWHTTELFQRGNISFLLVLSHKGVCNENLLPPIPFIV